MKQTLKKILRFITNPRFLLCWGLAWIITNGWSYVLLAAGIYFDLRVMQAIAGAYLTFLWLPISPEKLVTALIAMLLLDRFFPDDEKTLAVVKELYAKAKQALKNTFWGGKSSDRPKRALKAVSPGMMALIAACVLVVAVCFIYVRHSYKTDREVLEAFSPAAEYLLHRSGDLRPAPYK